MCSQVFSTRPCEARTTVMILAPIFCVNIIEYRAQARMMPPHAAAGEVPSFLIYLAPPKGSHDPVFATDTCGRCVRGRLGETVAVDTGFLVVAT
jgi:hypothetical protein